jgi:uncharacterized protein YhdP
MNPDAVARLLALDARAAERTAREAENVLATQRLKRRLPVPFGSTSGRTLPVAVPVDGATNVSPDEFIARLASLQPFRNF